MRKLSDPFMAALKSGVLADLRKQVLLDKDLDLQIRDGYLNIYYKGNSLLRLTETATGYLVNMDAKFRGTLVVPPALNVDTISSFLKMIPELKDNIIRYGNSSLEIEYEQLLIRANNGEPRNNSEYFILDRQYSISRYRFDLIGFHWGWHGRRREQEVPLCLMEVKFALNSDIQQIHNQLEGYYKLIQARGQELAHEYEGILRQKLELDLFNQPQNRIEAMKTLRISPEISKFRFVIILVDYNPHSTQLHLEKLETLPFAKQIWIFHCGFAMWDTKASALVT
jgi:hypothetical protein